MGFICCYGLALKLFKMAKITKWTEWLKGCSEVSETEGFPKQKEGSRYFLMLREENLFQ